MSTHRYKHPSRVQANIQILKRRLQQVIPGKPTASRGHISRTFNKRSNVALVKRKMIQTLILELERCLADASHMRPMQKATS